MEIVWKDRKRPFLGLPWSFTVYKLDEEKLYVKTGVLNLTEDEVRLYRIKDITPYGRWTYVVQLEGTEHDALITHEKYEELEKKFS